MPESVDVFVPVAEILIVATFDFGANRDYSSFVGGWSLNANLQPHRWVCIEVDLMGRSCLKVFVGNRAGVRLEVR